jgi:hypothetical protein
LVSGSRKAKKYALKEVWAFFLENWRPLLELENPLCSPEKKYIAIFD